MRNSLVLFVVVALAGLAVNCGDSNGNGNEPIDCATHKAAADQDGDGHYSVEMQGVDAKNACGLTYDDCCDAAGDKGMGCSSTSAAQMHPGATEIDGDGIDQNCDTVDPGTEHPCTTQLKDYRQALIDEGAFTATEIDNWDFDDAPSMTAANPTATIQASTDGAGNYWDAGGATGKYWDDLDIHPGCTPRAEYTADTDIFNGEVMGTANEATVPAGTAADGTNTGNLLEGYKCAAKIYDARPAGIDDSLPIVILQHGNSGSPNHFEEFFKASVACQEVQTLGGFSYTVSCDTVKALATELVERGYQVIASDLRPDLVATLDGVNLAAGEFTDPSFGDALGSVDHGWGTPILQHMLEVLMQNTTKKISIVGHSYGYSVVRDALRRIYLKHKAGNYSINPFTRIDDLILCSGTAHGVANGNLECQTRTNLRSVCNCQMGDRESYQPTEFNMRLNGPRDLYATPCADGYSAYGDEDACGDNPVNYNTITMKDIDAGVFQDEYVSEGASGLQRTIAENACVTNNLISTENGFDASGFFMLAGTPYLANHLGAIRSREGILLILDILAN